MLQDSRQGHLPREPLAQCHLCSGLHYVTPPPHVSESLTLPAGLVPDGHGLQPLVPALQPALPAPNQKCLFLPHAGCSGERSFRQASALPLTFLYFFSKRLSSWPSKLASLGSTVFSASCPVSRSCHGTLHLSKVGSQMPPGSGGSPLASACIASFCGIPASRRSARSFICISLFKI